MSAETVKLHSDIISTWLSIIGIILGGGYGLYQYMEKEKGDRIATTLAFLERYNKSPVADARERLENVWLDYDDEQLKILANKNTASTEHPKFVLGVIGSKQLGRDITTMESFYSSLEVCIENNICEESVAASFFANDAKSFFDQHYAFIDKTRKEHHNPDYGTLVSKLARSHR
jgi:hypothetical protein